MISTQAAKQPQSGAHQVNAAPALPGNGVLHQLNAEVRAVVSEGLPSIDKEVFAACWQRMGAFRDLMLIAVAQEVRHQFRSGLDQAELEGKFTASTQGEVLGHLLANVIDFAFALLSDRQIVVLSSALLLAFEADMDAQEIVDSMGEAARKSVHQSKSRVEAMSSGLSAKLSSLADKDASANPGAPTTLGGELASIVSGGPSSLDKQSFAVTWQRVGTMRDLMLIALAQEARGQYRDAIIKAGLAEEQNMAIRSRVLEPLMQNVTDFAFEILSKRQIVVLSSALALAFESEMEPQDLAWILGNTAVASDHTSGGRVEAMVIGVAGQYKFDIEPIHTLGKLDSAFDAPNA